MAAQAGLSLTWLETPEDTFSHDEAQLYFVQTDFNLTDIYKLIKYTINLRIKCMIQVYKLHVFHSQPHAYLKLL